MIITEELIKWAEDNGACEEGITQAKQMIGQDVHSLDTTYRTWVMARRKDCPIALNGLSPQQRAHVMVHRPECLTDLTWLTPRCRA